MKENITLGDIAAIQTGPFGSQLHASDYVENGIPVIMPTNIGNNLNIEVDAIAKINEDDLYRLSRYQVFEDDIVYSRRGDVERCAFITKSQNNWLCGTGCLRVRFKKGDIVPKFFAYQLSTDEAKGWISGHAVGSTMPNLNSSILAQVPLFKPDVEEQRAIAAVLSNLDDKIDLLRRQNATLEAMAEALFKQWFVVARNEEWEERYLGDLVSITRGASPRPIIKFIDNGTVPWIKIADATSSTSFFINKTKEFIIDEGVKKSVEVFPGDLILSNSATCGQPFIVNLYGCIHDGWLLFRNFEALPKYILLFLLKYISRELNQIADGSVQDNLNTDLLKNFPVRLPDTKQLIQFNNIIQKYVQKIHSNQTQICTLEKLRDTLLPKLMSGEVRVALG